MKKRLHDKKAGIAILISLIVISLAEALFRSFVLKEAMLNTSNFGEQVAVVALATTILILTAMGKDRACYICYGAWIGYFVLDQLFELFGVVINGVVIIAAPAAEVNVLLVALGWAIRVLGMIGVMALGILLVEYMCDGTICNRVFNALSVITILLILGNLAIPAVSTIIFKNSVFLLDVFNCLYRLTMVFMFTFFAYDSAKMQLKKTDLSK